MINDVYKTVKNFRSCAARNTLHRHQIELQLLPPSGPLKFIVMDIGSPSPKTSSDNQYDLAFTDRHKKLTRAIPDTKVTSTYAGSIFVGH